MSSDYSTLDKVFHRVVLGNAFLGEMLSDLDGSFAKGSEARDPVFVTGLARAGTTVLMRALHGSGDFASLTYADMPMVLAPNLWARLSGASKKERVARERAHGDGVMVDFDAPEALEEVFWRTRCGADYITPDALIPHVPDAETLEAYDAFQARVCHRYGKPRYLAKNNNMMLRLPTLAAYQPRARFLVPVRDPLGQAQSLRAQHMRFREADPFTRDYMRWLVHHEFGADQRPFRLPDQPVPAGSQEHIDYWLTQWIACYGWLLDLIRTAPDSPAAPRTIRPVVYEQLGTDPAVWEGIADFAGISPEMSDSFRPQPRPDPADFDADPDLLARARTLYDALAAL